MPIVDGLTSTKMIRSFEKTHPGSILSTRASSNGRIPIIAVSASLVEKERQTYIDAGFDAWILKPISFARLSELMIGIVDASVREKVLYEPGQWERGGWFHRGRATLQGVKTEPSSQMPPSDLSKPIQASSAEDDPRGEDSNEQKRLLDEQKKKRKSDSSTSARRVHYEDTPGDAENPTQITPTEPVASPDPV